jgi:hypothetical protein
MNRLQIRRKVYAVDYGATEGLQAASALLVRNFGLSPSTQLRLMRWLLPAIALAFLVPAVVVEGKAGNLWQSATVVQLVLMVAVIEASYLISRFVALLIILRVDELLSDGNLTLSSSTVGQATWERVFAAVAVAVVCGSMVVAMGAPLLVGLAFAMFVFPGYLSVAIELFLARKFLTDESPPTWYKSDAWSA